MYRFILLSVVGFFFFILWVIYMANTGQNSIFFDFVRSIPYGDKIGHFCLFGVLTLGANYVFKFQKLEAYGIRLFLGTVLVIAFIVVEELSQHFVPTRTLDLFDLLADAAGVFLFSYLSEYMRFRFPRLNLERA